MGVDDAVADASELYPDVAKAERLVRLGQLVGTEDGLGAWTFQRDLLIYLPLAEGAPVTVSSAALGLLAFPPISSAHRDLVRLLLHDFRKKHIGNPINALWNAIFAVGDKAAVLQNDESWEYGWWISRERVLVDERAGLLAGTRDSIVWGDGIAWAMKRGADLPPEWICQANLGEGSLAEQLTAMDTVSWHRDAMRLAVQYVQDGLDAQGSKINLNALSVRVHKGLKAAHKLSGGRPGVESIRKYLGKSRLNLEAHRRKTAAANRD